MTECDSKEDPIQNELAKEGTVRRGDVAWKGPARTGAAAGAGPVRKGKPGLNAAGDKGC